MTLYEKAFLKITDGNDNTATFEFKDGLRLTVQGEKNMLITGRGQLLQEVANNEITNIGVNAADNRRRGFTADAGGGRADRTLEFQAGLESESIQWGDGDGGTGAANVTESDASGQDVKPLTRLQVLDWWLTRTRTDSGGQAALYWGEWTDGSVGNASAGVYGEPETVAVMDWNLPSPDVAQENAKFEGSISMMLVAPYGESVPEWVQDAAGFISEQIDGLLGR